MFVLYTHLMGHIGLFCTKDVYFFKAKSVGTTTLLTSAARAVSFIFDKALPETKVATFLCLLPQL